jgi:transcriptional regulator with XRE-family HTH domain
MAFKAHLDPQPTGSPSQRRSPRRALELETSGVLPSGHEANVTVHNISAAGLLLETDIPLSVGDSFGIDLPHAGHVDAQVVWASERLYGCAFERALGQGALAATQLRGNAAARPAVTGLTRPSREMVEPLGIKLNRLRRERGLTLADVASALGVSKPTVWAWEKSKARPVPSRIPEIATALGVSTQELGEAAPSDEASAVTEECRVRIAAVHGTSPENIRIMIEV